MENIRKCDEWIPLGKSSRLYAVGNDFEDVAQFIVHPERHAWSDAKETVWDWMIDDMSTDHTYRDYLLGDWFDGIGISCSCHEHFGEQCVIVLGKSVKYHSGYWAVEYNMNAAY